jgi:hypothetical protein
MRQIVGILRKPERETLLGASGQRVHLSSDVDPEIERMGAPLPPMFRLRDPSGNALSIVEPLPA